MTEEKQEEYCTLLRDSPEKGTEYKAWAVDNLYICGVTGKPCIAREIEDRTQSEDVFPYAYPVIDEEKLSTCPAWNVPVEKALQLLESRIQANANREKSLLEQKLKGSKRT